MGSEVGTHCLGLAATEPIASRRRPSNPSAGVPVPAPPYRPTGRSPITRDSRRPSSSSALRPSSPPRTSSFVLSERGGRPAAPTVDPTKPGEGQTGVLGGPGVRMVDRLEEAPRPQLHVVNDVGGQHDGCRRDAGGCELLHDGVAVAAGEPCRQLPIEQVVRGAPAAVRRQRRLRRPRGIAEHPSQPRPLVVARRRRP